MEFSIVARHSGGWLRPERWRIDVRAMQWDRLFTMPRRQDHYDEAAFRYVAALSGWRFLGLVPRGTKEHWLYFTRFGSQ